jgi:uncharacterized repeat protein (TIGR04138 family)
MEEDPPMIQALRQLVSEEKAYPINAYVFLYQALDRTQNMVGVRRHVTGQELLEGVRELAIELFGPLTLMVFKHWNLTCSEDFGRMVFHLVERELMGKTDEDKLEDFSSNYDFQEAFAPENLMALVDPQSLTPSYSLDTRQPGSRRIDA